MDGLSSPSRPALALSLALVPLVTGACGDTADTPSESAGDEDDDTGNDGTYDVGMDGFDWLRDGMVFHGAPMLGGQDLYVAYSPLLFNHGDAIDESEMTGVAFDLVLDGTTYDTYILETPIGADSARPGDALAYSWRVGISTRLERSGVGERTWCVRLQWARDSDDTNDERTKRWGRVGSGNHGTDFRSCEPRISGEMGDVHVGSRAQWRGNTPGKLVSPTLGSFATKAEAEHLMRAQPPQ